MTTMPMPIASGNANANANYDYNNLQQYQQLTDDMVVTGTLTQNLQLLEQIRELERLQERRREEDKSVQPLMKAISANNYAANHRPAERGFYVDPNTAPSGFDIDQSEDYEYHPSPYEIHPDDYHVTTGSDYPAHPPPAYKHNYKPSHHHHHHRPQYYPVHPKPHYHPDPPEPIVTITKDKKSKKGLGSTLNAITLLAFFFFINILQNCLKDHMNEMNPTVMVLTQNRKSNHKMEDLNSREQTSTAPADAIVDDNVGEPEPAKSTKGGNAAPPSVNLVVQPALPDINPPIASLSGDSTIGNNNDVYNSHRKPQIHNVALIAGAITNVATPPTPSTGYVQLSSTSNRGEIINTKLATHHANNYDSNYDLYAAAPHTPHQSPYSYPNHSLIAATSNVRRRPTSVEIYGGAAGVAQDESHYMQHVNSNNNDNYYRPQQEYAPQQYQHQHHQSPYSGHWSSAYVPPFSSPLQQQSFEFDATADQHQQHHRHRQRRPYTNSSSAYPAWSSASLATHSGGSPFYNADIARPADHYNDDDDDDSYYARIN